MKFVIINVIIGYILAKNIKYIERLGKLMKKIVSLLLVASLLVIPLTGCKQEEEEIVLPPAYPVTINGITIDQEPLSFASLTPALTDLLLELDELHRIVGYSNGYELPDYPEPPEPVEVDESFRWFWEEAPPEPEPYIEQMPNGEIGTALNPDLAKIGEYLPEIIFTALPVNRDDLEKLNAVNIKVIELPLAKTLEQVKENYLLITKAIYGQNYVNEQTTETLATFDQELEYIYTMLKEEGVSKPSFIYVNTAAPLIATPDTLESEIFSVFANNQATGIEYTLSTEEIAGYDPDYLFYSSTIPEDYFYDHTSFNEKSAVIGEKNMIRINANILKNQSLTILDDVRAIGNIFYPNIDFVEPPPPVEEIPEEEPSFFSKMFSFFHKDITEDPDSDELGDTSAEEDVVTPSVDEYEPTIDDDISSETDDSIEGELDDAHSDIDPDVEPTVADVVA